MGKLNVSLAAVAIGVLLTTIIPSIAPPVSEVAVSPKPWKSENSTRKEAISSLREYTIFQCFL